MHRHLLLTSVLLLGLAGCGSDQKEPDELTGTLQGGHIQGVEWRTATRSGTTGAAGTFAYLPGESVTFSIGNVELGTAAGAPDITLFTLAGLTPPTTERTLRRELDRALRTSTPFTRAINLDLLLLALDADGDPANGIDVRNRAASMSRALLDFDRNRESFESQLYSTVPSLNRNIPTFKPVAHLYAALGLRIPVHALTRVVSDAAFPGLTAVHTYSYYADGALRSEDDDGNGDGVVDTHQGYQYDAYGRPIYQELWTDYDRDGERDNLYQSDAEFDAHGKYVKASERYQSTRFDPIHASRLIERLEDDFSRVTREVREFDDDGDGTADGGSVLAVSYDPSGARRTTTVTTDAGLDGVIDIREDLTETFDSQRRILSRLDAWDFDGNGTVDARYAYTYTYDDVARTLRVLSEEDRDGNGVVEWRGTIAHQLDGSGNVLVETSSYEPFGDGVQINLQRVTREFDADRRVTRRTRESDDDADGAVDSTQLDTASFDDIGNVIRTTSDGDWNGNGVADIHFEQAFEYGADGEWQTSASNYSSPEGYVFLLQDERRTATNVVVDDGVRLLTDWYYRGRYSGLQ